MRHICNEVGVVLRKMIIRALCLQLPTNRKLCCYSSCCFGEVGNKGSVAFVLFLGLETKCVSSAAKIVGHQWLGLNDREEENQFVYTDGTPFVSDGS